MLYLWLDPISAAYMIMMKSLQGFEENMSNLTTASGDQAATASPNQQSSFFSPSPNPPKKKRNLPGNPDPNAEVITLSPKTLMATNRFLCEICNKGFQRDQNLQLHRRGHNLPWKLKQRSTSIEAPRKKVYVCPEATCVHHKASRALGDLTGIKKHFSRKHGDKKYKCDKCSKKYAVRSDWKAHSKTCGTKEYKCDCGTIFSRRDSFITHRAFCDALAEERAKAIPQSNSHPLLFSHHDHPFNITPPSDQQVSSTCNMYSASVLLDYKAHGEHFSTLANYQASAAVAATSPHLSATALLQKAAQMGATMSIQGQNEQMVTTTTTSNDGLTRDFLGLRSFSHKDILSMAGLPWHGLDA